MEEKSDYKNRRTFAIISHPDAGKTTLTEKLLLYGNAIELAGNVRARRNQRTTTSDWMEMERERGISISSTVLQFPYRNRIINLLDTPGHEDFSEDTFRTVTAVDSAVMVLDAAKGIEPQTRRLFEVCRKRSIPIFTFINKMDRPAREPLELLDEIEELLGMQPVPINWPIGDGLEFKGVYDRASRGVYFYERTERNEHMSPEVFIPFDKLAESKMISPKQLKELLAEIELLDGLGIQYDPAKMLTEEQTPVFFGSALTNFGVRLFLDSFVEQAPPPQAFESNTGLVSPDDNNFSGFIFKIQANMNPKHRDSVSFVRVISGVFERGMNVIHAQSGKVHRLTRPYKFFGTERLIIDEALPGDIIGLPNTGDFAIGDTFFSDNELRYMPIPRFQPEHFAVIRNTDIGKQKQFLKGVHQLEMEGAMQVLYRTDSYRREPILAVVGQLQLDVVQSRLDNEYNVETIIEPLPFSLARWVTGPEDTIRQMPNRSDMAMTRDSDNNYVALFYKEYFLQVIAERYPDLKFVTMD